MVKGDTVFSGYYNKPEETAKVLIYGWNKTGDEGHLSPLGNLVMNDSLNDLFKTSSGKYVGHHKLEAIQKIFHEESERKQEVPSPSERVV